MEETNFKKKDEGEKMLGIWKQKKELEYEVLRLQTLLDVQKQKLSHEYEILKRDNTFQFEKNQKLIEMDYNKKLTEQAALYEKSLRQLEANSTKEQADLKAKLAKEYYDKMSDAMTKLNLDGSSQSKFVQELSLKMFDKALEKPMPSHIIEERHLLNTKRDV